jgi:hypothetical protein
MNRSSWSYRFIASPKAETTVAKRLRTITKLTLKGNKPKDTSHCFSIPDSLLGLSGSFVDDIVRAETLCFKSHSDKETETRFDGKHTTENEFGLTVIEAPSEHRFLSQFFLAVAFRYSYVGHPA